MIAFHNFRKRFKGNTEDVLNIPDVLLDNEVYWLKGKNGVGKTSLIKSIAGIIPFEGQVSVDGVNINKNRMLYRLSVNYAEAEPLYPGFLTGTDLIDLYAYTKKATANQVNSLIKRFEVLAYKNNKLGSYSSGMIKKLSLLLAFIGQPTLILLDEPFITLDPHALTIAEELIAEYHSNGTGFIIASHQDFSVRNSIQPVSIALINKTIFSAT
jgi:ABC-2 type transport system ATP-binding protein